MKKILNSWISKLRSDNYRQAKRTLRTLDNRYDCMAILVDCMKETGSKEWDWVRNELEDEEGKYERYGIPRETPEGQVFSYSLLPVRLLNQVGLTTLDQYHLQMLNDQGASFNTIANYIERYILNRN